MADESVKTVSTLTSIFLIVPPSLINNSSVVASPDVRAVCPEITLSFMCSLSTASSAILASVIASAAIMAVSTDVFAMVNAPASLAVASPDTAENMYFLTLSRSDLLFVPPPPSSTIISSASTRSAPISVPPSISKFAIAKAPALAPT